jgi:hypothetical protein
LRHAGEIACDPNVPPHVRLKAAEAGVQYERPKLSANVSAVSVGHTGPEVSIRAFEAARPGNG